MPGHSCSQASQSIDQKSLCGERAQRSSLLLELLLSESLEFRRRQALGSQNGSSEFLGVLKQLGVL